MLQGELAIKNVELEVAAKEAEKLLAQISESTFIAEKEKAKVAVIVDAVTAKAQARLSKDLLSSCSGSRNQCCCCMGSDKCIPSATGPPAAAPQNQSGTSGICKPGQAAPPSLSFSPHWSWQCRAYCNKPACQAASACRFAFWLRACLDIFLI